MEIKEILLKLPSSWEEVKTGDFIKLIHLELNNNSEDDYAGFDNLLKIVSVFTKYSYEELEELKVVEISKIGIKLNFIQTDIPQIKSKKFIWKGLEEVTMDDYLTYLNLGEDKLKRLDIFIKVFNKNKLTEEEILELPIGETMYGFFLFKNQLKKLILNLTNQEQKKMDILFLKLRAMRILKRLKLVKTVKI